MGITRRELLKSSAAAAVLGGIGLPMRLSAATKQVKIGFLAPLTGEVAAWGLPGLYGCEIWAQKVNDAGGIKIGGDNYQVEFVSFDNEYLPEKALQGFKKLVSEEDVKFVMMLGGDTWPAVQRFANQNKILTSTLLPSDLSPDSPYHIAPCEVHPIYNVTGVQWMAEKYPNLKKAVMCAQNDSLGLPSVATYLAAFEAEGIEVIDQNIFDPATTDFAPIVSSLLAKKPDIFCLDTCYADYVNLITEQLYHQKFEGKIISCTFDNYSDVIAKTSKEFVEGFIFQFPDFDDEALNADFINFKNPNGFYADYVQQHPGTWSAVSWEYASIMDLWKSAAEQAGSVEPLKVLDAMKSSPSAPHAFGTSNWWGKQLWGIDNALVGNWPVVTIQNGKARIVGFKNIPEWWQKHGDLLVKHMRDMKLLWDQQ
ncbi:MAG: ABC transporter substrate-binding protein [Gammaproteobacteria bacterium]|nr:ABC transporter substrate-binding protein [Gammaproteobacteria bacterium]